MAWRGINKMAAIYIEYYVGGGAVRNISEGECVSCELEKVKLENPGKRCWIIGTQSFGVEPCGGPESDMMPGY